MIENIAPYFIAFILFCIFVEIIISVRRDKNLYEFKDTWTSLGFGIIGVVSRLLLKGSNLAIWYFLYYLTPFKI